MPNPSGFAYDTIKLERLVMSSSDRVVFLPNADTALINILGSPDTQEAGQATVSVTGVATPLKKC